MTGAELKQARLKKKWTQRESAKVLGLSQTYVSLLEGNHRTLPKKLMPQVLRTFEVSPTALPVQVSEDSSKPDYAESLGALGYPGFAHLKNAAAKRNPAVLLLEALKEHDLDSRVAEALPWLVFKYSDMNWEWLVQNVKLNDLQNRLGFVVSLARGVAEKKKDREKMPVLGEYESRLERSRLAREDTFCQDSLTQPEREWLRQTRPAEARHWNLLTDLAPTRFTYAT